MIRSIVDGSHPKSFAHKKVDATTNILTVDLEDWFHICEVDDLLPRKRWDSLPSFVVSDTEIILDMLNRAGAHATFFVLGYVAEKHPDLIRLIHAKGHEIAYHGWDHELLYRLQPHEFRSILRRGIAAIEDLIGKRPLGFRAPQWSLNNRSIWALDILSEEGFVYDSSMAPLKFIGDESYPERLHRLITHAGSILEFPPFTLSTPLGRYPAGGGWGLRCLPSCIIKKKVQCINEQNIPAVFYFHPREVGSNHTIAGLPLAKRFVLNAGIRSSRDQLLELLLTFKFTSVERYSVNSELLTVYALRKRGERMEQEQKVYEELAAHLDRLPVGFPRTPSGVEIRILRRLFNPREAATAQLLKLKPETAQAIAARSGQNAEELASRLEEMSRKGLIFRIRKGSQSRYMASQFLIGIWEYHVNDLDPELIRDVNEYLPFFFEESNNRATPQLRTIPIPTAISSEQAVMPYEEARRIISEQELIIVAPCICRKEHKMTGKGCDRPLESCLVFGAGAQYYQENGLGRPIDRQEALKILEEAEKSALVLQPSNSQKVVNICTCCGCCCQILKNLKRLPKPAQYVASNYYAVVDESRCSGCEACIERCQMEAVAVDGQVALIDRDRCIGCGLCVPTCPEEAIRLVAKPEEERSTPPPHYLETYQRIAKERIARLQTTGS